MLHHQPGIGVERALAWDTLGRRKELRRSERIRKTHSFTSLLAKMAWACVNHIMHPLTYLLFKAHLTRGGFGHISFHFQPQTWRRKRYTKIGWPFIFDWHIQRLAAVASGLEPNRLLHGYLSPLASSGQRASLYASPIPHFLSDFWESCDGL